MLCFCIDLKQKLYSSVYTSQGTMEQLLVSRGVQLLNSQKELANLQVLRNNQSIECSDLVFSRKENFGKCI